MKITPIHTRIMHPPQDDLFSALEEVLPPLPEKSICAITSKVVSINEGRCVDASYGSDKDELIQREAEQYIPRDELSHRWVTHTLKNNILASSAGIDHSNAGAYYVLWPRDAYASAREIRVWLQKTYSISDIGVVITDSRSMPLRRGVIGMSLGHAGFHALYDYRGDNDVFGNHLQVSISNIVDSIADTARLVMGEGGEQTPCALVTDLPQWYFENLDYIPTRPYSDLEVPPEEDMYLPLFDQTKWQKGGGGNTLQ